jgi:hypothetical protein
VRSKKGSIRGRVKADLPIVFTSEKLTAHGGLELFLRFSRLRRLPTDRTVSNTLKETTQAVQDRLHALVRTLAYDTVREAKLSRLTLELDGTVLRTGPRVEGAERGLDPPPNPSTRWTSETDR